MRSSAETPTPSRGWPSHRGVVTGYLWKLIRESASMTQTALAEDLGVDVASIQAWESGRRPLTALRAGDLARYRIHLLRQGASPALFGVLPDAIEADLVIDHALATDRHDSAADRHPLAATVHRRDLTNLITWPITGITPTHLRPLLSQPARRGPVARHPVLLARDQAALLQHLVHIADAHQETAETLLRRQAVYLLSFDANRQTVDWLAAEHTRAMRHAVRPPDLASWMTIRSSAIGLSRYGQPDALSDFVRLGLADHQHEVANLAYWAYWVGEITEIHTDDRFMTTGAPTWNGATLLAHLINRVTPGADQIELNVHTLAHLLLARPNLLAQRPDLRQRTLTTVSDTLDSGGLRPGIRQELSNIAYAARLAAR
ncbi:helix-turn-helix domain-containing protein [Hamadaea tsunoensis]|uniref:helix-turn-helix domain-containing protein n=1 Tax=Hamadaea tsunoensis TaxID=53368 RepID=UPI0004015BAB|nr:helix-turn-helix transcriptional regulator [Hamadaea tsunoensis]